MLILVLGVVTCGIFFAVNDFIQAAWLNRIRPGNKVMLYYIVGWVAYLLRSAMVFGTMHTGMSAGPGVVSGLVGVVGFVFIILARFTMRTELERHYNTVEPIGLRLGPFMTFFFGGLYFAYHFNKINEVRRAMMVQGGLR